MKSNTLSPTKRTKNQNYSKTKLAKKMNNKLSTNKNIRKKKRIKSKRKTMK